MSSALIFLALVGSVMFVVGLALIIPELAIDSPLELLISLFSRRWEQSLLAIIHAHILAGWPETKLAAVLYFSGMSCLGIVITAFLLITYLPT
ncbi:MAG TPA: hypothetical protein VF773_01250 [Verrucomicrobiae bacterium]